MTNRDPRRPAKTNPGFRCGHPRAPENTKRVRNGTGTACLACFRLANRDYVRRVRAAAKRLGVSA